MEITPEEAPRERWVSIQEMPSQETLEAFINGIIGTSPIDVIFNLENGLFENRRERHNA